MVGNGVGIGTTNPTTNTVQIGAGTTGIYINSSGSVGLGTTVPRTKLDVIGNISGLNIRSNYSISEGNILPNASLQSDGNHVTYLPNTSSDKYCFAIVNGAGIYNVIANSTNIIIQTTAGDGVSRSLLFQSASGSVKTDHAFIPRTDNSITLGADGSRWSQVWVASGVISSSDQRDKTNITSTNLGLNFIQKLNPVSYKWIIGVNEVIKKPVEGNSTNIEVNPIPGQRTHYGLLSQEVKEAFEECGATDFGGWVLSDINDPESQQALRYDQFIAPLIKAIQEQQEIIESQNEMITALKNELATLKERLDTAGIA